jgi:hypothetical protein
MLASSKPGSDGDSVQTVDGTFCHITHEGSLCNSHFTIPNIFFVPELSMDLLSVGQITDQNCFVGFDDSYSFVQDRRTGVVIGTGHHRKSAPRLYILDTLRLHSLHLQLKCFPLHQFSLHLLPSGTIASVIYVVLAYQH